MGLTLTDQAPEAIPALFFVPEILSDILQVIFFNRGVWFCQRLSSLFCRACACLT